MATRGALHDAVLRTWAEYFLGKPISVDEATLAAATKSSEEMDVFGEWLWRLVAARLAGYETFATRAGGEVRERLTGLLSRPFICRDDDSQLVLAAALLVGDDATQRRVRLMRCPPFPLGIGQAAEIEALHYMGSDEVPDLTLARFERAALAGSGGVVANLLTFATASILAPRLGTDALALLDGCVDEADRDLVGDGEPNIGRVFDSTPEWHLMGEPRKPKRLEWVCHMTGGGPAQRCILPVFYRLVHGMSDALSSLISGETPARYVHNARTRKVLRNIWEDPEQHIHAVAELAEGVVFDSTAVAAMAERTKPLEEWLRIVHPEFRARIVLELRDVDGNTTFLGPETQD